MKTVKQRERMKKNNPMKNKEYALKNGLAHRKPFFIGDKEFQTLNEAAIYYNVTIQAVKYWLKTGHKSNKICYYKNIK